MAPSPPAARAAAFALHLRTAAACRLAVSATGGARKPNPSEGAEGAAAPCTEFAKVRAEVKPAVSGLPSSVTVQCQGTAPRHLPQGEGKSGSRRCRPRVRERIAEARAAGGEGTEKCAQHPAPHLQPKKAALRLPFLRWHSACSLRRQRLVRIIFSCGGGLPRLRALQVRAARRGLPRRWEGSPLRRPEASWCRQCGLHCRIR